MFARVLRRWPGGAGRTTRMHSSRYMRSSWVPEPSHAAVAIEFLPVSLFAKGGLARDEAALEWSVRATRPRAAAPSILLTGGHHCRARPRLEKLAPRSSRILLASVDGIAHSLARYCTDMSACEWRVRVAPRAASLAPRIRAWTRAPTPPFTPGALVGVSNRNRAPVPQLIAVGTRAFAFEAFAFAAQEEKARSSEGASRDETSATYPGDDARTARLEQLQNAYTNRAPSMGYMAPKLPENYKIHVEPPPTGSGKTRIVVTLGADDGTSAGGEVIGWVTCWVKKSGANALLSPGAVAEGDALFLSSVEVKKSHRRMGIASRLLHEAEALGSRSFGCDFATLTVLKNNDAAIALYESRGYAIDDGSRLDAARKLASVLADPQRLVQHRMTKRLGGMTGGGTTNGAEEG